MKLKMCFFQLLFLSGYAAGVGALHAQTLSGSTGCTNSILTVTSSLQPTQIVWELGGTGVSTVSASMATNATTVAGSSSGASGSGANQLSQVTGVYVDGSGNIYMADSRNHRIQKWAPGATAGTTVAGTGTSGTGANQLTYPYGVYVDGSGNLFITDQFNQRIQKWAPGATAGTTVAGSSVGTGGSTAGLLAFPTGVYVDGSGNIFIADNGNSRVQKWAPGATTGVTVAGTGIGGTGADQLWYPTAVYVDASGNIYVADDNNSRVQKWAPGATAGTTVAGSSAGVSGNGANRLSGASGLYVDGSGNIYVSDYNNNRIQEWAAGATSGTTVGGSGGNGAGANQLNYPRGIWLGGNGSIYVADWLNNRVQKFAASIVTTYNASTAGNYSALITTTSGSATTNIVTINATPLSGTITGTFSLSVGGVDTLSDAVPGGVWHSGNSSIASVDGSGGVTGVAAGTAVISYTVTNSCGSAYTTATVTVSASGSSCSQANTISTFAGSHVMGYSGDNGAATAAKMGSPYGIAADPAGNVFIADYFNNVVRMVNHSTGTITTVAGTGVAGYNGDNKPGQYAQLNGPRGVTVDASGTHEILYIADKFNERIRKLDLWTGTITTVAGTGHHADWQGYGTGNGGPAIDADLSFPASVALDCSGNMYIADLGLQCVRKIDASGIITIFAGTMAGGYNGDNIPATTAKLNNPSAVAADCSGNVWIADAYNNRVRMVDASGTIITVAGNGVPAYSGDGGPGGSASLWIPTGVTLDACGNLYISDWQNNVVRLLTPQSGSHIITTVAGKNANDWHGYDGDGGNADSAYLYLPGGVAIDGYGNVYIADYGNYVIRALGVNLPHAREFKNGTTQDMTIMENQTTSVDSQMAIPNTVASLTETWEVTVGPQHGVLSGFPAIAASAVGTTIPGGLTYTPDEGYVGPDEFTVRMSDGATAASTTVNLNVVGGAATTLMTLQQKATLYPNPNNGSFQFVFTASTDAHFQMIITDVTGRKVYVQDIAAVAGTNVVKVNLPFFVQRPSLLLMSLTNEHTKYPVVKISVTE